MTLTPAQARTLVRLLGQYQDILENDIDGELIPEGTIEIEGEPWTVKREPTDPEIRLRLARDRKRWQQCETAVTLLAGRKRRAKP